MGLFEWLKSFFSLIVRVFAREDRFKETYSEFKDIGVLQKAASNKLNIEGDMEIQTANASKLFMKLPAFFIESKPFIQREAERCAALFKQLQSRSIYQEEVALDVKIKQWSDFKIYMESRTDVTDRIALLSLTRKLDQIFDKLVSDIRKESRQNEFEAASLRRLRIRIAREEGVSDTSSEEQLVQDAVIESGAAAKEEDRIRKRVA